MQQKEEEREKINNQFKADVLNTLQSISSIFQTSLAQLNSPAGRSDSVSSIRSDDSISRRLDEQDQKNDKLLKMVGLCGNK